MPEKWKDRLDRGTAISGTKEPQTIGHWHTKYLSRVSIRANVNKAIRKKTSDDRRYKLVPFLSFADKLAHITTIDSEDVDKFHTHLSSKSGAKETKEGYFKAFRMFVRWSSQQTGCDLNKPANLDSREFIFTELMGTGRKRQEKKRLLWTKEEFITAVDTLPDQEACFLMLMLNCGFRHVDLCELLQTDFHESEGRIIIQRHKLNQQHTAPVISYKLWPKTIELLNKVMSPNSKYLLRNKFGGSVEDSLKTWWTRNRDTYARVEKQIDVCWACGYGSDGNSDAYYERWGNE